MATANRSSNGGTATRPGRWAPGNRRLLAARVRPEWRTALIRGHQQARAGPHEPAGRQRQNVTPLDTAVEIAPPFALPEVPGPGRCLVNEGPSRQVAYNVWEWSLVAVRLDGTVVWKHPMDVRPHGVIADAAGTTVTWSTPTEDRWSKYNQWFDLSNECIVRAVSATGEHLWTWHPPGPITATPVIGAKGEVYLVAGGYLWALG